MPTPLLTTIADTRAALNDHRSSHSGPVVLVPTMGALHQGHAALIRQGRELAGDEGTLVVSIFVNPTQFAAGEDLDQYPRTLEQDCDALDRAGADAVFLPDSETMYPPGFSTYVQPPQVGLPLEGEFRPTHFRGVATVVLKLFHLLPATHAFFGRKDYQQYRVIDTMVRDLNVPIRVVPCEIVRQSDGLALSSRNRYLSDDQRRRALRLSQALQAARRCVGDGVRDPNVVESEMRKILAGDANVRRVDRIDYAVIADPQTLQPVDVIDRPVQALIAAHVGQTRLIDNLMCAPPEFEPGPDD